MASPFLEDTVELGAGIVVVSLKTARIFRDLENLFAFPDDYLNERYRFSPVGLTYLSPLFEPYVVFPGHLVTQAIKEDFYEIAEIEEANWLTLTDDVQKPGEGFDAVICLGNSFAHLPDFKGDQSDQKLALKNIASMVKPGGILIIDHRNYDYILETGRAPQGKNIYYKSDLTQDIATSVLWVDNKPHMITLDYTVQVPGSTQTAPELSKFRLSYYPHRIENFKEILMEAFHCKCEHSIYGDFKTYTPGQSQPPCYFIHVVKKNA